MCISNGGYWASTAEAEGDRQGTQNKVASVKGEKREGNLEDKNKNKLIQGHELAGVVS